MDKIPAIAAPSVWTATFAAGQAYKQQQLGTGGGSGRLVISPSIVRVKNLTEANRRAGDVVSIGDSLLDELDPENLWFEGVDADTDKSFGILTKGLADEEIGPCQVSGVCIAYVNVTSTSHRFAKLKEGQYNLESAASGSVEILYKPSGTGELQCAVLLGMGSQGMLLGKPDSGISAGASGTISIYSGVDHADTGENLTAYAIIALTAGKWVGVELIDGVYHAFKIEC